MSGNMWTMFHFVPIAIAAFGAVSWSDAERVISESAAACDDIDETIESSELSDDL